jgi:hypothetical protein
MAIEVYPPGTHSPYGKRVGGMRTRRKLSREFDNAIGVAPEGLSVEEIIEEPITRLTWM